jgi:hypothetical protein
LESLEAHGLIVKVPRTRDNGSHTSNEYRFPSRVAQPPRSHKATPPSRTARPPEPEELTRSRTTSAAKPRERNPIWDALTYVFGEPTSPPAIRKRDLDT